MSRHRKTWVWNGASGGGGGGGGGFDPATLPLTGWWRGDYSGAPWVGEASAGTSGGRQLIAGIAPATGTALNGHVPADFNGSTHYLDSALTLADVFTDSAGTLIVLARPTVAAADSGTGILNPGMIRGAAYFAMGFSDAGLRAAIYDGGYNELTVAASNSAYHLFAMTWDGATLRARVDSGAFSSTACGPIASMAPGFVAGISGNGAYFTGTEEEIITADTVLADADVDNVRDYFNSRYALSL